MQTIKRMIMLSNVQAQLLNEEFNTDLSVSSYFNSKLELDTSNYWSCNCDIYFNGKDKISD